MGGRFLLSLDLSTTCTGWSLFDLESKSLLNYGTLRASVPGKSKLGKLERTLRTMLSLANDIKELVILYNPEVILVEEIAGSKNRLGQKTLDGFHWIVLFVLEAYLSRVVYYDVTGAAGWRTDLKLRLSDADKHANKEAKRLNKSLASSQQIPIVGPKHLAVRFVNSKYSMSLNFDERESDGDVADSVAMGTAYLLFRYASL